MIVVAVLLGIAFAIGHAEGRRRQFAVDKRAVNAQLAYYVINGQFTLGGTPHGTRS